jgi:FkbM family methyltransferase
MPRDNVYRSQFGQDRIVEKLFDEMRGGVFVELGGMDGRKFSNTSYLEDALGWTGVLIEPNPELFPIMVKNRPNTINVSCAIASPNAPPQMTLMVPEACPGLSGIRDFYDNRHGNRILRENRGSMGTTHIVEVRTMASVLLENNIFEVHYMSVDVEGAEEQVVSGIDFQKTFIHLISFEANYPESAGSPRFFRISSNHPTKKNVASYRNDNSQTFRHNRNPLRRPRHFGPNSQVA